MATVEERDALRVEVLGWHYDRTDKRTWLDMRQLVDEHPEADRNEVEKAVEYLKDRGLLGKPSMGPLYHITPDGIDAYEQTQRSDANDAAALAELSIVEFRQVEPALAEIRALLEAHRDGLQPTDVEDLEAQIATVEAQARSPRPRRGVIGAAMAAAVWVVDNAGAELVGAGTLVGVRALAHALGF